MLSDRLGDPAVHWITLTGPGGVGKTRLAIEAVNQLLAAHPDEPIEAVFVPLFGIFGIDQALDTIARRLAPSTNDPDSLAVIRSVANNRRLIVELDNADGLIASGRELANLLSFPECRQVTLFVTSRTPFTVAGEHLLTLNPLPIPASSTLSAKELRASPAVALFLDRASAARLDIAIADTDLTSIAAICRRVDCLPLGIELAASRLRQLSLAAIANLLAESRFNVDGALAPHALPGHVGLERSIASSFDLLNAEQQQFFMRLSGFSGGISLESARRMAAGFDPANGYPSNFGYAIEEDFREFVGDFGVTEAPALRARAIALPPLSLDAVVTLEFLADQSLLQRAADPDGAPRFQFLETINEFALNRLVASGQLDAVNNAHMAIMLALVEVVNEGMWTAHHHVVPAEHLAVELANVRRAIDWLIEQGPDASDLAIRMTDALLTFWQMRGLHHEGIQWIERAMALPGEHRYRRLNATTSLGFAYWMTGDFDRAEQTLLDALQLASGTNYATPEARGHFYLALVEWRKGPERASVAVGYLQEAMRLFAEWEDHIGLGVCNLALGEVVRMHGDTAGALELFTAAITFFEKARYAWGLATAQWFIGEAERGVGNERRASEFLAAGLISYRAIGDRLGMAGCMAGIAALLAARQEWESSARLFGAASTLREFTQSRLPPTHESDHETIASLVVQTIGPEAFLAGRSGDLEVSADEAMRLARAVEIGAPLDSLSLLRVKKLSRSRREVLLLLAEGLDVKAIAHRLDRGVSTVYRHVDGLMADLDSKTQEELRAKARLIAGNSKSD